MYRFLGWLNVALLVIVTSPYWFTRLNKLLLKLKGPSYLKFVKMLRTLHKPFGLILAITAPIHGYMALGTLRLHTGTLVFAGIVFTAFAGGTYFKTRNKTVFKVHKTLALFSVAALLLHLLKPGALYGFF